LLNDYTRVGKSSRIFVEGKRPGRKATYQGELVTQYKLLEPVDFKCIEAGYALFVDDETASRRAAYDKMLSMFYKVKDLSKQPESVGQLLPTSEMPSYRQFAHHGRRFFDETTTARGRMGDRKWQKDGRGLEGTVRDNLRGPCHQFEIDSTVADIYLVNSYSRHMLIGRPIIYIVIDSYSGMIVGLYVGLEGPSWNGARQALFNAFTPKRKFCALNGVNISDDDWPCHHMPYEMFADRAEMLGEGAEGLASGLGIDIGIAPPFRPDWKSMVESRFNILNSLSGIRWMPGGVASRNKERGERDYRLDATLNMREFTKIIIKCVLHYNKFHRQPARLSKPMVDDQVEPTPFAIWKWAIENDFMRDNNQSEELVYLNLLPRETGSVRKNGILFRGMHYVSEYLTQNNWTAIARNQGSWPIECWHLHESANHIWIRDANKQFVRCDLRKSDQKYADYRSDEVYDMLEAYRQVPPSHTRAEIESRVALLDDFEGTFDTAALEKKQTPSPKSKSRATGNIREQRSEELARERASAQIPDGVLPTKAAMQEPAKTDHSQHFAGARGAVIIDMLKRIRPGNKP
ncbi:Mu transposase C-terminal domain-containing protein, partial [Pseudomonas syringae]|uniref:Mu transposase C-terminal domain-containing protein n=2 Tax=Pseudomonas TaxID=286 RepID=UPI001F3E6057